MKKLAYSSFIACVLGIFASCDTANIFSPVADRFCGNKRGCVSDPPPPPRPVDLPIKAS